MSSLVLGCTVAYTLVYKQRVLHTMLVNITFNNILTALNLVFCVANAWIAWSSWQFNDKKSALISAFIATLCFTAVVLEWTMNGLN